MASPPIANWFQGQCFDIVWTGLSISFAIDFPYVCALVHFGFLCFLCSGSSIHNSTCIVRIRHAAWYSFSILSTRCQMILSWIPLKRVVMEELGDILVTGVQM